MAQNLGQVKAVKVGTTAPTNTTMLWYDTNIGVATEFRPKIYDTNTLSWIPLAATPKYSTSLSDALAMPEDVGGILSGTTVASLKDRTYNSLFDDLFFPTVLASILSNKSSSLVEDIASTTVEVGTTLSPTLTVTFNRGQIQNGDGTAGASLVGLPSSFDFSGLGIVGTLSISSTDLVEVIQAGVTAGFSSSTAILGNNNWSVTVNYDAGVGGYTDNKGNVGSNLDGSRGSGTSSSTTSNTLGRYRLFYGSGTPIDSSGVRSLPSSSYLSVSNTGTVTTTIGASDTEWAICLPAGKTSVIIDLDAIGADVTGDYVKTTFNVNDANGVPVSYDKYQLTLGVSYGSTHRHQITVS